MYLILKVYTHERKVRVTVYRNTIMNQLVMAAHMISPLQLWLKMKTGQSEWLYFHCMMQHDQRGVCCFLFSRHTLSQQQGQWRQLRPLTITLNITEKPWLITGHAALNNTCESSIWSRKETLKVVCCNVVRMFISLRKATGSKEGAADMDNKHTVMATFKARYRKNFK